MSVGVIAAVGLLGGAGAIARFLLDAAVALRVGRDLPFGTFAVNVSGAFVLVGAGVDGDAYRLAGTGFLGACTTFSTWALESHRLGEDGRLGPGVLNFVASLAFGVAAAWLGRELGA
jgi:CrcB protein